MKQINLDITLTYDDAEHADIIKKIKELDELIEDVEEVNISRVCGNCKLDLEPEEEEYCFSCTYLCPDTDLEECYVKCHCGKEYKFSGEEVLIDDEWVPIDEISRHETYQTLLICCGEGEST